MLNVLIKNNSQITLYLGILSILYWQNWLLHVKKQTLNSNSKGGLRIA